MCPQVPKRRGSLGPQRAGPRIRPGWFHPGHKPRDQQETGAAVHWGPGPQTNKRRTDEGPGWEALDLPRKPTCLPSDLPLCHLPLRDPRVDVGTTPGRRLPSPACATPHLLQSAQTPAWAPAPTQLVRTPPAHGSPDQLARAPAPLSISRLQGGPFQAQLEATPRHTHSLSRPDVRPDGVCSQMGYVLPSRELSPLGSAASRAPRESPRLTLPSRSQRGTASLISSRGDRSASRPTWVFPLTRSPCTDRSWPQKEVHVSPQTGRAVVFSARCLGAGVPRGPGLARASRQGVVTLQFAISLHGK